MPRKYSYTPTEADRLTGLNVRKLRRLHGETLLETIDRSGVGIKQSSLSRIELGQRPLSLPEATKLAAHWNTTADRIFMKPKPAPVETEQQFLGNEKPALFAVPEDATPSFFRAKPVPTGSQLVIDRNAPMTPEQYRAEVWIPYLENRYAKEAS